MIQHFGVDFGKDDKTVISKFTYKDDTIVNIEWREIEDAEFSKCTNNSSKISN